MPSQDMMKCRYFFEIEKGVHVISFSPCNIHSKLISSKVYFVILVKPKFLLYYEHMVKQTNSFKLKVTLERIAIVINQKMDYEKMTSSKYAHVYETN